LLRENVTVTADRPGPVARTLRPNLATNQSGLSATNLLHDIDRAAQEVIDAIGTAQASGLPGPAHVPGYGQVALPRAATVAELRRHKRVFLRLATQSSLFEKCGSGDQARRMFIDYVRKQLETG
jgi:protein KTI12